MILSITFSVKVRLVYCEQDLRIVVVLVRVFIYDGAWQSAAVGTGRLTNTNQGLNLFYVHRWPDVYLGLTTMGQNMSVPNLQRALGLALATGPSGSTSSSASGSDQPVVTAELMVHPGYPSHPQEGGCGEGPDDFSQSADRQHELSVLRDPSLQVFYSQERVQLCAFKDLLSTAV